MHSSLDRILTHIEEAIATAAGQITEKGRAGEDKLNALSRLVNSYGRLFDRYRSNAGSQEDESEFDFEHGDPDYVEALFASTAKPSGKKRLPRR